jgi:hypothetical protein
MRSGRRASFEVEQLRSHDSRFGGNTIGALLQFPFFPN